MAYGPMIAQAFMSYGPRITQKADMKREVRVLCDKLPNFQAPPGCEAPPPGAFTLYAVDMTEAKENPDYDFRSMPLDDMKCIVVGSSRDVEGLVYDGHRGVLAEHTALYYAKGKWFIKAINGNTNIQSMTLHPYLRDSDGRPPRRFQSAGKKSLVIAPVDNRTRLTRERCVFQCADSDRIFWLVGPLPLGEGEVEEVSARSGKKDDRGHKEDRKGDRRGREKESRRERERDRRSRSASSPRRSRSAKRHR